MNVERTCSVDGCARPLRCRGVCEMHYTRLRKWGHLGPAETVIPRKPDVCSVPDCERTDVAARGWCVLHYGRWQRHGDPLEIIKTPNGVLRKFFEEAVLVETDDCMVWPYGTSNGYGTISFGGSGHPVHRLALERTAGPPPEGKPWACHGPCHNRLCFNPRHLYWGSDLDNARDRHRDGTHSRGEANPAAKLTADQVEQIRIRYAAGGVTQRQLAEEYGVSAPCVSVLTRRKTWK